MNKLKKGGGEMRRIVLLVGVLFPSKKRGVNGIDGVCIYSNECQSNR